jgi:predicted acetyltransferase
MEITRRRATFRSGVPDPGGVRLVEGDELRTLAPPIHRRWARITPGAVSRSEGWWHVLLVDREHNRHGSSRMYHLAHPDGYASYRMRRSDGVCEVVEVVAVTGEAYAALWRILLGLDLITTVRIKRGALDEPLPDLLTDARQVRTTELRDGMWARVLDVPAALSARRYAVELDVVVDVHDAFLDLGGRFRLRGGPDGAECERVDEAPDGETVRMGIAALGSLLFGARRAQELARAGQVGAADPAVLRRLDAAMAADRSPHHGTEF